MRTPGVAKHEAIRDELRHMVLDLAPGDPLPAERVLAERWGVARMTVRQAIAALAREGLVLTLHGRGNLRAPQPLQLRVRLGSFADALREHQFLRLDGKPAMRVRRLRLGDEVPLALERAWFPAAEVSDLTEQHLASSLYQYLDGRGLLPDSGDETVIAGLPDDDEVRQLDIPSSRPVLRLTRRALTGGRPIEYAEAVFPADRYQLWFPLKRLDTEPGH